jgi:hypothetical protein
MNEIHAVITGPEEAYDNAVEFWCANELMPTTFLDDGRRHLRIDPRADGSPWLAHAARLANSLTEADERLRSY